MTVYPLLRLQVEQSAERHHLISIRKDISMKPKIDFTIIKRILLLAITVVLIIGAVAPDVMNVPLRWRAWWFVTSIFWIVTYTSGTLNS